MSLPIRCIAHQRLSGCMVVRLPISDPKESLDADQSALVLLDESRSVRLKKLQSTDEEYCSRCFRGLGFSRNQTHVDHPSRKNKYIHGWGQDCIFNDAICWLHKEQ